jgi:O-antigen ligase
MTSRPAHRSEPRTDMRDYLAGGALVLALFGYSLYALVTPATAQDGSGATVIFRAALIGIFGVALLAGRRRPEHRITPLWPMYIFLALYTLRLVDNFYMRNLAWNADPSVAFGLLIGAAVLPVLCLSPLLPLRTFKAFGVPMALGCVVLIVGVVLNREAIRSPELFFGRVGTEKLNPISMGAVASSFALFLLLWRSRAWWTTLLRYALATAFLGVALLTQSRGPLLGTVAALLMLFFVADKSTRKRLYVFLLVGGAIALIGGYGVISDFVATGVARFQFDDQGVDDSANGRLTAWSASWGQFLDSPLIGDRVFEPVLLYYPHNLLIESLISVGILGSIFLIYHIVLSTKAAVWILKRGDNRTAEVFVALMFVKEFVQAQFSGAIYTNTGFWVASACTISVWSYGRRAVRAPRLRAPQPLTGLSQSHGGAR